MLYWSASATPARLAIGTAGYTLQATANGPAWTQTVAVANGGTGATSFTSGALLIGNGTNAVSTRTIKNMTAVGDLGWTAAATDIYIPTVNTLAYWNGRYNSSSSNLAYCSKGAFGNAATYGVDDATTNGALGTGTGLTTERSVYYGLVTVNNASQTRATGIYAPTSAGTANQILVSAGGTSAPTWKATANGAAYATDTNGALTFGILPVAQGGTGNNTGTATYCTTAADTSNTLYPLGVTSTATTTIKRNTNITIKGSSAWVGTAYFTGTWWGVYATHNDTTSTRYGYIQINATDQKMYFRGENGVEQFNFNHAIYTSGGNISAAAGNIWAGTDGDTTKERDVGVRSGAGILYLFSTASATGSRGLYAPAHGNGGANTVISIDTNNVASFNGNAATATKLANERTISLTGSVTGSGTFDGSGNLSIATTTNHGHTFISNHSTIAKGSKPSSAAYLLGSWGFETGSGIAIKNRLFGFEGCVNTNGRSSIYLMAYQNTADSTASNTFSVWMDQDGTRGYSVSDAAAFRSAIGAGTSSLTIGTTASTAAAGNHDHDGTYVNVDGDTMTGDLNCCDILPATTATSASTGYNLGSNTKRYRAIYVNQGIFVGPQGYTSSTTAYNGSTMGSSTFHSTRTTAGGGYYVRDADTVVGRFWYQVEGTTTAEGKGTLQLGNDIADKTDKNASGRIRMYGSSTGFTDIDAKYGSVAGDSGKTYLAVGYLSTTKVTNAVWNDYAECRVSDYNTPGRVVLESSSGRMQLANDRLLPGCKIISDTFGNLMGESETAKTPIAVAGRVLVYPYQDRSKYELGAAVCSAPNGTVDIMTREEIREYPERIIGTVSEIPTYEIWQAGSKEDPVDVQVNGRIWIYVR